jgi:cytidylate kinase
VTGDLIIAIDGPAGSGKSTLARAVAEHLGCRHLDTGAMYRAVTLLALRSGVTGDAEAAAALAREMTLAVNGVVVLDGEDVTAAIRTPEVDAAVSEVSAHPAVRSELVARQRRWAAESGGAVVEGRDIGSVVFPDARLKVFLTAHADERARRRAEQLASVERDDPVATGDAVAAIARRDGLDSSRAISPLVVPDGAIVVDSTGRPVADVVEEVLSYL